jgi:uncharacterized coiled-coil DUF342 family protein
MTDPKQPLSIDNIPDVAPIAPEEVVPMQENLIEVAFSQKEVKGMYQRLVDAQAEKLARLKASIKSSEVEKRDRDFILFKIQNLKDQVDENSEALHYAQQDYDSLVMKADLSEKATEARAVVERLNRDIAHYKQQISELERKL